MKAFRFLTTRHALALYAAILFGAANSFGAVRGTLVLKEGREITGDLRWRGSQRVYVVTADKVEQTINIDNVEDILIAAPPATLDPAIAQVKEGRFGASIPALKAIVSDYEMLKYDVMAARWLAKAYSGNKQPAEAIAVCEKMVRDNPEALSDGGLAAEYADALLAANQTSKLKDVLGKIIELGSRDSAAIALIKRGDMEMKSNNYKDALVDGYLRTVLLFESVKECQPEALYKASRCFDLVGQAAYAEKMRKKLLQEYPQSPFAGQVSSGK